MTRDMWALALLVAAAAAVLSFSSLTDLAMVVGFHANLAWLLPITLDAGAAAGCRVWLGARVTERARRTARSLTWTLLGASVGGNAVVHYLGAYHLEPPWWLVVIVSAVAPIVLGAVVHLLVLVARGEPAIGSEPELEPELEPETEPEPVMGELAAELIAQGAGRRRIAKVAGISEHAARQLLAARNGDTP